MNQNFQYDLILDYEKPTKAMVIAYAFVGLNIIVYGAITLSNFFLGDGALFDLFFGGILLMCGIITFYYIYNGCKPLIKEGQVYLKIEDGKVISKLHPKFSKEIINLNELENHKINDERVILKENGKDELYIDLKRIQSRQKREEFVGLIKAIL